MLMTESVCYHIIHIINVMVLMVVTFYMCL